MSRIRNFSIIAHIDHGKTTLTDQLLLQSGQISQRAFTERLLDSNPIEQERGITIKLAPVRMKYSLDGTEYILNLIDTPGHVDFSYEVSRSLAACEAAILLLDTTQGVQAQTLSHLEKAKELDLPIIPVLNKIDLPAADIERVTLECMELLDVNEDDFISVSAKTGEGVEDLFKAIVERVPAPEGKPKATPRALVFSSFFDQHKGVLAQVRVVDGQLKSGDELTFLSQTEKFTPVELGVFLPKMTAVQRLETGEVGYIATGLKRADLVKVGDTVTLFAERNKVTALPGYREPASMVYMKFFPKEGDELHRLTDALGKLQLHDSSLQFTPTHSKALGNGYQVGFLGLLHAEIVRERLEREFNLELIISQPSVTYRLKNQAGETWEVKSAADFPEPSFFVEAEEPIVTADFFTPKDYVGAIMQLCEDHRGRQLGTEQIGGRLRLRYELPLAEIITNFFDTLKSVSSGYASLEYRFARYQPVDVVRVDILINREEVSALSFLSVKEKAQERGKVMVSKLKDAIPRQLIEIPIQAAIGGTIIARETVKAFRKDVTAKLYGGDRTRRMKLLVKQKKGKKKMQETGKVALSPQVFFSVLKSV